MPADSIARRPPRVALVNLATGERMDAWANPPQLAMRTSVNWNRLSPPGANRQPLQFTGTGNLQLTEVELTFDRTLEGATDADLMRVRTFLDATTVPSAPAAPPPTVLLVWPGVLTLEVVVASVDQQIRSFAVDGTPLAIAATLSLEQVAPPHGPGAAL
jgi:hypothetical protein